MVDPRILVRPLQADDEVAWRRLWAGYLDFYGATVPPEVTRRTWRRILNPASPVLGRVATLEGAAAGFAVCIVHEGTLIFEPTFFI